MTQFYVGSAPYGGDYSVLEIVHKNGNKLRFDGDYHHVSITDANGAGKRAYLDPVETWEEFSAIVKEFLKEQKPLRDLKLLYITQIVSRFGEVTDSVEIAEEILSKIESVEE